MEIPASAQKILNAETAALKLDRIAFQILENTFHSPEIVMIGIKDGGYIIAEKITEKIRQYYPEKNSITFFNYRQNKSSWTSNRTYTEYKFRRKNYCIN